MWWDHCGSGGPNFAISTPAGSLYSISWPAAISLRHRPCANNSSWHAVNSPRLSACCSATSSRRWACSTLRSDFDNGRHDHRLAAIGFPPPFADSAPDGLRDPRWIGDMLCHKRFQLCLDLEYGGLQRLRVLGEAARIQMRP